MKITVTKPVEIDVAYVRISVPVRYGEEDIPNDFPLRKSDLWEATVDLQTGVILGWPIGKVGKMHMKVCDGGAYTLLDADQYRVSEIEGEYVPHGVVPGEYGDYIILNIDESGKITNWPKKLRFDDFFNEECFSEE